jgi:hypothetical protein
MGKASRTKKERVIAPPSGKKPGGSSGGGGTSGGRPKWLLPVIAGALLVIIVALILATTLGGSSAAADVASAMKSANCTLRTVKPLPPVHDPNYAHGQGYHADVPTLKVTPKWSTDPPSAGAHYGLWAVWSFYRQPVDPRMVVHNEEHGGMIMWWGDKVSGSDIDKMNSFYNESPNGMVGTPYKKLGNKIALTAWTGDPSRYYKNGYYGDGHIAICSHFDQKAFTAFRNAYRGHSIEGISVDQSDVAGTGPSQ